MQNENLTFKRNGASFEYIKGRTPIVLVSSNQDEVLEKTLCKLNRYEIEPSVLKINGSPQRRDIFNFMQLFDGSMSENVIVAIAQTDGYNYDIDIYSENKSFLELCEIHINEDVAKGKFETVHCLARNFDLSAIMLRYDIDTIVRHIVSLCLNARIKYPYYGDEKVYIIDFFRGEEQIKIKAYSEADCLKRLNYIGIPLNEVSIWEE